MDLIPATCVESAAVPPPDAVFDATLPQMWGTAAPQVMDIDGVFHAPIPLPSGALVRWTGAPPAVAPRPQWIVMGALAALADLLANAWHPALTPLLHPWLTLRALVLTIGPVITAMTILTRVPVLRDVVLSNSPVGWAVAIGGAAAVMLVWGLLGAAAVAIGRGAVHRRRVWAERGRRAWAD